MDAATLDGALAVVLRAVVGIVGALQYQVIQRQSMFRKQGGESQEGVESTSFVGSEPPNATA